MERRKEEIRAREVEAAREAEEGKGVGEAKEVYGKMGNEPVAPGEDFLSDRFENKPWIRS